MQNNNKVSVIVPVYKAEKYIRKCIESILNQTYYNIELILVDDGSPDASRQLCDEYAKQDMRIIVLHQQNSGVSAARNLGLSKASGYWIMFVDSDDWLEERGIETCVNIATIQNLDLLQFATKRVDDEGVILQSPKNLHATGVLSAKEYIKKSNSLGVCVWGGLLKNDIIQNHHLLFDGGITLGEDQLFMFRYTHFCNRCKRIGDILYDYRFNPTSATSTNNPLECLKSIEVFQKFEFRQEFEFYIQRAIFSYFLYPIIRGNVITYRKLYKLIKHESFDKISPGRKLEKLFFPMYRISKHLGLAYLMLALKLIHD